MSGLTPDAFERFWTRADSDAEARKFSHEAVLRLLDYYRALDQTDREVADGVISSWLQGGDARKRFDALALIDEFGIRSALLILKEDLSRLTDESGPSSPSDQAKLERIISRLEHRGARG